MKTIQIQQEFDVSLDELLLAREERYAHLDRFPELKNTKIVRDEEQGETRTQERHILLTESLPAVVHEIVPTETLSLVEHSVFNNKDHTHTFQIKPGPGLEYLFLIKGVSKYVADGENRSIRTYEATVESGVFLAGGIIEATISDLYKNSLENDRKSIVEFLKMRREESP